MKIEGNQTGIPNFGVPPQDSATSSNKVGQSDQSLPATSQVSAAPESVSSQRPNPVGVGGKCDFTA